MGREADRPWTRSASGRALAGAGCMTALPAMMPITVRTASVEPTCCAIVRQWPSRCISRGPATCTTSCSRCMRRASTGVCATCTPFPLLSATTGSHAISKFWQLAMRLNHLHRSLLLANAKADPSKAPPKYAGCAHGACRTSAGLARRPAHSFYQQPGRAGTALGQSAAKDLWHVSQRQRSHRVLPHPQLSFHHAEARALHAGCSYRCLPWSTFTGRLATSVVTKLL